MKFPRFPRFSLVNAPRRATRCVALCCALCATLVGAPGVAGADDFSPIAASDPIYSELAVVARAFGDTKKETSLTRYEAALRTARTIFTLTEDASVADRFPREGWKALSTLIAQLKPELGKMNVETASVLTLANRALQAPISAPAQVVLPQPAPLPRPNALAPRSTLPLGTERPIAALPVVNAPSNNAVAPSLNRAGGFLSSRLVGQKPVLDSSSLLIPLSQRLRLETALLSLQRESRDPFGDSAPARLVVASPLSAQSLGVGGALSYDVNSWLSTRVNYAERDTTRYANLADLALGGGTIRSAGGGLDIAVGDNLRFTTDIQSLAAQTGERGTRVGGGVGLSAWQNRLSLSAHLSRLVPEDSSALASANFASTLAELNVGVDVTQRLSLNLLYQGLFSQQSVNNASRVGGGISLSF